ncbi:MAG: hypothetical protein ACOYO1_14400 [Bacteroidales bacterium]
MTITNGYLNIIEKTEIFKEISSYFNGEFSIIHNSGNVLNTLKITIPYNKWKIVITESDTKPLKFQVDFETQKDYELVLGIEDFLDKMLKKLGLKEIEIGREMFDKKYLIQTNNLLLTKELLAIDIQNKILENNIYSISYLSESKDKKSQLLTVVSRTLVKKDSYIDLVLLHKMLIDCFSNLKIINN